MESQVKILAVAPYEGLAAVLEREADAYENVAMTIVVGNLEAGVERAIEQLTGVFDLILSRGGTADMLRDRLDIPVVDIRTSSYDVLQAVQLSEGISGRRAVVGFSGIADAARNTSEILSLGLDIFTLVGESDVWKMAQMLSDQGYETVLCDVIASTVFRENGFNTVLISSGSQSVRASIDEALRIARHLREARNENRFLREVIRGHGADTVVFTEDGRLFLTTLDRGGGERLLAILRGLLPHVLAGTADAVRRIIGGYQHIIRARMLEGPGGRLVAFYLTRSRMPSGSRQAGISSFTCDEARREYLESPYSLTGDIAAVKRVIEDVAISERPLLVTGEYGTGRTAVASFAYTCSPRSSHPLIEIDCGMLNEKSRDFLLNSRNSPVFSDDATLHIKNMETSPEPFIRELFSTLATTGASKRCGIIFSCNPRGELVGSYISYIKDKFQSMQIRLAPLRETRERIPTLAKLLLSQLNTDLPKTVLRIDAQAMELLGEYPWPGNYIQFKRVISQLCISSRDHAIRAGDVRALLALERPVYQQRAPGIAVHDSEIDLGRQLAEIERDVVEMVVKRHGGNQSAAARQLGISRTTLWRRLRDA
ncbi:sigma-54-dependent transcriptional regulator [Coriobacteriales bacterium OH1046]|nr:sigma-54-dependent transcriptional regulator [Coriobacteriales bacterium OH1046]